jgi:excisionase family DNA binding protein
MTVTSSELSRLPALIGVEQACALLGISRSAGYRAAATGDLPTIRFGRRLYVPTARLCALIGLPLDGEG